MKKYLKTAVLITAAAIFAYIFSFEASADFDTDSLYGSIPESAAEYLEEKGITPESGAGGISAGTIISDIIDYIGKNITAPSEMFAALIAVVVLTAVIKNISASDGAGSQVYSLVSSLTSAAVVSSYISRVISDAGAAAEAAGGFMLTYIPVMAGVIAVGGHASAAAAYSSSAIIGIELLAQITRITLIPLTGCMLGISAVSGIKSGLNTSALSEGIKKAITWVLGLIMTLFLGLLSVQTTLAASSDSIALRTARFFVSSGVPIVGGAVSDALSTVSGSLGLIKTGIGGFGMAAGAAMLLPAAVDIVCHSFFLFLAGLAADLFGSGELSSMIKAGRSAASLGLAVTVCFMLFMNISTAMLLTVCR